MDYDDNDFQSQNLRLAGEGSNKFPPVLRPYSLSKFDFEDSLQGHSRFDSLVGTEVFLGIESNEDNQWIEDFSRASSGIQFTSTVPESCSISRCNNVWSEATSSESVEMLLKSVGQEEIVPVQADTKEPDNFNELGCISKQMEPNLKQDDNTLPKAVSGPDSDPPLLPKELPKDISFTGMSIEEQKPQIDDSSHPYEGNTSARKRLDGLTTIGVEDQLPIGTEGSVLVDSKSNEVDVKNVGTMVDESFDHKTQESDLGSRNKCALAAEQSTINELKNGNSSYITNEAADNSGNLDVGNGGGQMQQHLLNKEARKDDHILDPTVVESGASHLRNILPSASVEDFNSSPSHNEVDGSGITHVEGNSTCMAVHPLVDKPHIRDPASSSMQDESIPAGEKSVVSEGVDSVKCEQESFLVRKESIILQSDSGDMDHDIAAASMTDRKVGCFSSDDGGLQTKAVVSEQQSDNSACDSGFTPSNKGDGANARISKEAVLPDLVTSPQVISRPESCKSERDALGTAEPREPANCSSSVIDTVSSKCPGNPKAAAENRDFQESTKDIQICLVPKGLNANNENDKKTLKAVQESSLKDLGMDEACKDAGQKKQVANKAAIVSGDPSNRSDPDDGRGSADSEKQVSTSSTTIGTAGLSSEERKIEGVKRPSKQFVSSSDVADGNVRKIQSVNEDRNVDASKDVRDFTPEVGAQVELPEEETGKKGQLSSSSSSGKTKKIVDKSPSTTAVGQLKSSQDISNENPKLSDAVITQSDSKSNIQRTSRRSGKTKKETVKRRNPVKEASAVRGDKINTSLQTTFGISQLVQSNDTQRYGLMDSGNIKPLVVATPSSSLPDLNSSSVSPSVMFLQPFTDLQQVQLRAQILVYGALIQGTVPDEAYMISAFGGLDGGRSIWESTLRSCKERLQGQKSYLVTPETPLESQSGPKASNQTIKRSTTQTKITSSPAVQAGSKGTPSALVNPVVPISSPLWGIPTFSGGTLQSSGMSMGLTMDYQRAYSPLHVHQTLPAQSLVGHSPPWISQSPFGAPWIASPQTSGLDTSGRFPLEMPSMELVKLTSVKEMSLPQISAAKHVPPASVAHSGPSVSFPVGLPLPDINKVMSSSVQHPTDPKPRKRKKSTVAESPDLKAIQSQTQIAVPTYAISTPVSIPAPISFVSKVSTENVVTSAFPTTSMDHRRLDRDGGQCCVLPDDTLSKVKEAMLQADAAAALATDAVHHSQTVWNQLGKQESVLLPDFEIKLTSAAVAVAAATAVAKAAAAAANVASNAALQAKLMAEEAVMSSFKGDHTQTNVLPLSDAMKLGKATPANILKHDDGTNNSNSILVAAKEAAKRRVEAASAASRRAENVDAIIKAAELAAEAVSQAGKVVAMGDPIRLHDLLAAGPENYWKVAQVTPETVSKTNGTDMHGLEINFTQEGPNNSARYVSVSGAASAKAVGGQKGLEAADLVKNCANETRSSITTQNDHKKQLEASQENSIKEGSNVEVFKDENGIKAAWFSANILSIKDGMAYVNYSELTTDDGLEKLKEWVPLTGKGDEAPKIRIARPVASAPPEGTKKRRRAATRDYNWSVGDRVDAWIQNRWLEGIVTEKNRKDENMLTIHFSAQGETSVIQAWHVRPSLMWKDGEWIECSSSREDTHPSHVGDTPQKKRTRLRSPEVEAKGKDKLVKGVDVVASDKPNEPTSLDLTASERTFDIGKSTRSESRLGSTLRMTRAAQKEGTGVKFGVPKPGKKRKFMEVSKHYVGDQGGNINEGNDSVKFAKPLLQGSGPRGWRSTKTEPIEKRVAASKPRVPRVHIAKTKDSADQGEDTSGKSRPAGHQFSSTEGTAEGPILISSLAATSDSHSLKKNVTAKAKPERVIKGKLDPAGGQLGMIEEDKVPSTDSADIVEPRRSNRRIQPTSRLLEGLQSSLMVSKVSSASSQDKSHKSRNSSKRK